MQYPWYELVEDDSLQQGDILLTCPVYALPPETADPSVLQSEVVVYEEDVIVLTQSCDLMIRQDGRCNVDDVILCRLYLRDKFRDHADLGKAEFWENVRKGRYPAYHVLNRCELDGVFLDYMLVDFRKVFTLPVELTRQIARRNRPRVRLLPPYREHLAQAFARFFMRVGLPVDVPPFKR